MHVTSYLHSRKPKNKSDDGNPKLVSGWNKVLTGLKLAALVRGLGGIRNDDNPNGGEASLMILIDDSACRVRVYDIYTIMENVLTSDAATNAINLDNSKPKGVSGKNILNATLPLYKNEWIRSNKKLSPWLAAKRRSTEYLFELHR